MDKWNYLKNPSHELKRKFCLGFLWIPKKTGRQNLCAIVARLCYYELLSFRISLWILLFWILSFKILHDLLQPKCEPIGCQRQPYLQVHHNFWQNLTNSDHSAVQSAHLCAIVARLCYYDDFSWRFSTNGSTYTSQTDTTSF